MVVTNGMVIPNYSSGDDYERMNALGVSQYGQMTAGSYMSGPQGIVHSTTITVLNAGRRLDPENPSLAGKLFVTMASAACPAPSPRRATSPASSRRPGWTRPPQKRHEQGWVDHVMEDVAELADKVRGMDAKEAVSFASATSSTFGSTSMRPASTFTRSDQASLHNLGRRMPRRASPSTNRRP